MPPVPVLPPVPVPVLPEEPGPLLPVPVLPALPGPELPALPGLPELPALPGPPLLPVPDEVVPTVPEQLATSKPEAAKRPMTQCRLDGFMAERPFRFRGQPRCGS